MQLGLHIFSEMQIEVKVLTESPGNRKALKVATIRALNFVRAQDWNRTSTSLRTADFESAASTNSATWAAALRVAILLHSTHLPRQAKQVFFLEVILLHLQQLFFGSNTFMIILNNPFNRFINFVL